MTHGDFGLLSPVSASSAVAALTGDHAVIAAILDVEASWLVSSRKRGGWSLPAPPLWWPKPPTPAHMTQPKSPNAPKVAATR